MEYRFSTIEVRADSAGAVVEGVVMRYGSVADIGGMFSESIEAGAFSGLDDVTLNRMHVREDIIARTDGGGLELTDSAERLSMRAAIPGYREDVRDLVSRKILRGLSVEMEVEDEIWPAPDRRIIRAAKLWGIGLVDRSAYSDATAQIAERARTACQQKKTIFLPLAV